MAVVNFFESTITNATDTKEIEAGICLEEIVNEYVDNLPEKQYVEVYFPDTDTTEKVLLEEDEDVEVLLMVNGEEKELNYYIEENDIINIYVIQRDNKSVSTGVGIAGAVISVAALIALYAFSPAGGAAVTLGLSATQTSLAVGCAWLGLAVGTGMMLGGFGAAGLNGSTSIESGADKKNLYGINGGNNEDIIGKRYPLILGKTLVNPYIVGSPYHETYTRIPGSAKEETDTGWGQWTNFTLSSTSGSSMKTDHADGGQYYKALYCVGYGPLKLTDFRIGETKLAYNRAIDTSGVESLVKRIEALQDGGNVNLLNREIIPSTYVVNAGWTDCDAGGYSTVYSRIYPQTSSSDHFVLVTPIIMDKETGKFIKVMTPSEWEAYASTVHSKGEDPSNCKIGKTFNVSSYGSATECIEAMNAAAQEIHEVSDLFARRCLYSTVLHGILRGNDDKYDAGDILSKWKNNDVSIEIIQAGNAIGNDAPNDNNKWSSIYPVTVKEDSVGASVLHAYDASLAKTAQLIYKNVAVPNAYRTNTVRFSKACPYRIEVELDMPSGMYMTNSVQIDDVQKTKYYQIPLLMAVQWRYSKSDETSSDAEDPTGWNTFDYEVMQDSSGMLFKKSPVTYTQAYRTNEILCNKGLSSKAANHNPKWIGSKVFELSHSMDSDSLQAWKDIEFNEKNLKILSDNGIITYTKSEKIYPYSQIIEFDNYGKNARTIYKRGVNSGILASKSVSSDANYGPYGNGITTEFTYYKIEKGEHFDESSYKVKVSPFTYYNADGIQNIIYICTGLEEKDVVTDSNNYTKDEFNVAERRFVFAKEFTPEECQALLNTKNGNSSYYDQIEVRVIRLTPCYLNQAESGVEGVSPMQYEDLVKWNYIRTWTFDKESYTEAVNSAIEYNKTHEVKKNLNDIEPADYPERPIPKDDLDKFCYVALSLKQDVAETGGSSLEKFSCIATSYAPNYDIYNKKWAPKMENGVMKELSLTESYKYYYIHFDSNGVKKYKVLPINPNENAESKSIFNTLKFGNIPEAVRMNAEEQYKYGTSGEYAAMFFSKRDGNNYADIIRESVFTNKISDHTYSCYPYVNNGKSPAALKLNVPTFLVDTDTAVRFESQNSAAVAVYSLIGKHLKNEAKTLDCISLGQMADMFEFCNDVTDGTLETYKSPSIVVRAENAARWNNAVTVKASAVADYINILKTAPVNAVWKGCYDYAIDRLMSTLHFATYNKNEFIKWLENTSRLGAADGLLHIQYKCNGVVNSEIKLETLFSNILITGRSSYRRGDSNKYEPIIGQPNPYPVTVINQRNCISKNNTRSFEETLSGFNVSYVDENDNYETNSFYVMDDGEDAKAPRKRVENFQLNYVTSAAQIRSLARYNLACTLYQRESYSRTVGYIGYSLSLGDVVLLQDDSLLIGTDKGGRIKELLIDDGAAQIVGFILDEPFDYYYEKDTGNINKLGCTIVQSGKYGQSRCVTVRAAVPDKTVSTASYAGTEYFDPSETYYIRTGSGTYALPSTQPKSLADLKKMKYYYNVCSYTSKVALTNVFILQNPISLATEYSADSEIEGSFYVYKPEVGNLVAFGLVGSITSKAVIMSIKPKDKGQFDLSLVPYNDDLYNYGERLPFFKSNMKIPKRDLTEFGFNDYPTTAEREEDKTSTINQIKELSRSMIVGYKSWYAVTTNSTAPGVSVDKTTGTPIDKSWTDKFETAKSQYNETKPYLWTGTVFKYNNGEWDITMEVSMSHYGEKGEAGNDYRFDLTQESFNVFSTNDGRCTEESVTTGAYVIKNLEYVDIKSLTVENDLSTGTVDITSNCSITSDTKNPKVKKITIPTNLFIENTSDLVITATVLDGDVERKRMCKLTAVKIRGLTYLDFNLDYDSITVHKDNTMSPTKITPTKILRTNTGAMETEEGYLIIEELPEGTPRYCGYFEAGDIWDMSTKYKVLYKPFGINGYGDNGACIVDSICCDKDDQGNLRAWVFYDRTKSGETPNT